MVRNALNVRHLTAGVVEMSTAATPKKVEMYSLIVRKVRKIRWIGCKVESY